MPKTTKKEHTGSDYISHQKNIDNAINNSGEPMKEQPNRESGKKPEYKPDDSVKKAGRTKH